eukprot:COSAG05_NODE_1621_length_4386_cov_3.207371_4_plen_511_part_00
MGKDHAKAKDAADTGVKSGFTNPMHLDIDLEDAGKELVTPSDDKISSPLRDSFYPGEEPAKSPKAERKGSRIVDIDGTMIDMNAKYTCGTQEWYLQERRRMHELQGRYEVLDEGEMSHLNPKWMMHELWVTMSSGGNLAAGVASALHVNIYLLALGMLLATPYMGILTIVRLAVGGTMIQQAIKTAFGSFGNFDISNCDTVPAAVFVNVLSYVVEAVEMEHYKKWESQQAFIRSLAKLSGEAYNGTRRMLGDVGDEAAAPEVDEAEAARNLCIASGPGDGYIEYGCYDRAASTILVATMITTVSVGFFMMLLGTKIKAGPLVSFIPITVQAAFLAGCGGSIFKKGLKFMVDVKALKLGFGPALINGVPVVLMCVFINYAETKLHHSKYGRLALPGLLFFLTAVFYSVVAVNWKIVSDDGLVTWSDAVEDVQQPKLRNSSFPPLDGAIPPYGRGWLLDPASTDGVDDSGKHHPWNPEGTDVPFNTLYFPQFTHFRMYRPNLPSSREPVPKL